jgi:NADH:ubiquinone reductase (H+-translocating)
VSQIVVLGAGYAGIQAARALARIGRQHDVTLVDRLPYHQLITQLPGVASGRIAPQKATIPLARVVGSPVHLLSAEITDFTPAPGVLTTSAGPLEAHWLVLALGSVASDLGIAGALEHATPLKSVRDAVHIRNRLRELRATRSRTRVVVVGGGYTGTEFSGEVTDASLSHRGDGSISVTIVQPDNRLLPQGSVKLSRAIHRILSRRGVTMRFNAWLDRVEEERVVLESGDAIPADLVVWAARTRPAPVARPVLSWTPEGRIVVDPYLHAAGSPRTFVAGDLAAATDYLTGKPLPASAQVAVPQGKLAAENIVAEMEGRRPAEFKERLLGEALALGRHDGAAELTGVVTTGRIALAVKRAALLRYLTRLGGSDLVREYL